MTSSGTGRGAKTSCAAKDIPSLNPAGGTRGNSGKRLVCKPTQATKVITCESFTLFFWDAEEEFNMHETPAILGASTSDDQ